MTTNIVEIRGQQATTTSLAIAEGCKLAHKQVIAMVRKYRSEFEELGPVAFETRKGEALPQGGYAKATEIAVLNEDQATYLITLFRNTLIVRRFKLRLVKEFRRALNEIARLYANPPRADLVRAKRDASHILTDSILEWRTDHDKPTNDVHYMSEQKLCNWAVCGAFQKLDESSLSNEDLELLRRVRERNAALIVSGIEYQERKARLSAYATKARMKLVLKEAA